MRSHLRTLLVFVVAAAAGPLLGSQASTTATAPPIIPPAPRRAQPATKPAPPVAVPTRAHPVDVNTASERELAALPGVGVDGAKRIVEARPYATVADLSRTGLPKETLDRIGPLVKVSGAGGLSTPMGAADTPMSPAPPPKGSVSPHPGLVWGDPDSRTYRSASDPASGRSAHGRWMTKSQAVEAGYRKEKSEGK